MLTSTLAMQKLARLEGRWLINENKGPGVSRTVFRYNLLDKVIIEDSCRQDSDDIVFEGHGVYGFDEHKQHYTMHWFDSAQTEVDPPAVGDFIDDKTLVFEGLRQSAKSRFTFRFDNQTRFTFTIESKIEGDYWSEVAKTYAERADAPHLSL